MQGARDPATARLAAALVLLPSLLLASSMSPRALQVSLVLVPTHTGVCCAVLAWACRTKQSALLKRLLDASSAPGGDPLVGLIKAGAPVTLIKAVIEEPHCESSTQVLQPQPAAPAAMCVCVMLCVLCSVRHRHNQCQTASQLHSPQHWLCGAGLQRLGAAGLLAAVRLNPAVLVLSVLCMCRRLAQQHTRSVDVWADLGQHQQVPA